MSTNNVENHDDLIRRIQIHTILNETQPIYEAILNLNNNNEGDEETTLLLKQCLQMSHDLTTGNYLNSLQSTFSQFSSVFSVFSDNKSTTATNATPPASLLTEQYKQLSSDLSQFLSTSSSTLTSNSVLRSWLIMLCGALCLNIFVQSNWTGPVIESLPTCLFPSLVANDANDVTTLLVQRDAIDQLSIEGELAYSKTIVPHYLVLAKMFLSERSSKERHNKVLTTFNWWSMRSAVVHQQILTHMVQTLKSHCLECLETLVPVFANSGVKSGELDARLLLEKGLMCHLYYQSREARAVFGQAKKATKLWTKLSGAMGVRTKFQTTKKAQLILLAKSRKAPEVSIEANDEQLPQEVQLYEECELLPRMELESVEDDDDSDDEDKEARDNGDESLRIIDQAIILCMCIDVKNNNPKDGLTTEEMFPYVNKVQEEPKNWMVYSTCLLLKSRLESEKSRTAERSVLQLQVLADQFKDAEPGVAVRMNYLYCLPFPPLFELNRELGDRFISLGAAMSALQVYEKLDMWDEIIRCYILMDKENKAKKTALRRVKEEPTHALLWCVLGDLKQNEHNRKAMDTGEEFKEFELESVLDYYERAWEVSNHRFSRAKRSIGNYHVRHQRFEEAIEPFEQSLDLSPLYPATWFTLGCSCMKTDKWDKALNAFTRTIQIEPDDGEAWSNLASCHMRLNNKEKAYSALQVALKHKYDSWKIWENYLVISIDLKEYQNACHAINRLVDLKLDKNIDLKIMVLIIKAYYQIALANINYSLPLREKIEETLEKISSRISMNPGVWYAYSLYYDVSSAIVEETDKKKYVDFMQKLVTMNEKYLRALQVAGWDKEVGKFQSVCDGAHRLVNSQLRTAGAIADLPDTIEIDDPYCSVHHYLSQAIICLKPIISRAALEEPLKSTGDYTKLVETLKDVEGELKKVGL